jgi:DNA-binding MarR family transcriptional regulator
MAVSDLTRDWALALQEHVSERVERPAPPGWLTTKGIADLLKITPPHASRVLSSMVKAGKAEMKKFSSPVQVRHKNALTAYGPRRAYTRLTPFFRLIKTNQSSKKV